jgi:hypothetical protein
MGASLRLTRSLRKFAGILERYARIIYYNIERHTLSSFQSSRPQLPKFLQAPMTLYSKTTLIFPLPTAGLEKPISWTKSL